MKSQRVTKYAVKRDGKFMTTMFDCGLFNADDQRARLLFTHKPVAQEAAKRLGGVVYPVVVPVRV